VAEKRTLHAYGPWKGILEAGGEDGDFEELWNCEIIGDDLCTRRGRQPLSPTSPKILPAAAFSVTKPDGLLYHDILPNVTKPGLPAAVVGAMGGNLQTGLYLGFTLPICELVFDITAANAVVSTRSVAYFGTAGWTALTLTLDETVASGTKPFGVVGTGLQVAWSSASATDWQPSYPPAATAAALPPVYANQKLYWIYFGFSAALTVTTAISKIRAQWTLSSAGVALGANGFYQWRTPGGERLLIIGLDDRDSGIARLFVYDRINKTFVPIAIPSDCARSGPNASWSFAAIATAGLALCNGYCFLYITSDDPYTAKPFKPVLLDAASSQKNTPPSAADYVLEYEGRLIALKDNTAYISCAYGDIFAFDLRAEAPLGGCNCFYNFATFQILDPTGGGITGAAQVGLTLVIFTARTTWAITSIDTWTGPSSCRCIDKSVGCIAPRSICAVDQSAILFLGPGGVYVNDGTSNTLVSQGVQKTIGKLNQFALRGAVGELYQRRHQYRLFVPDGANNTNNLGLVFDLVRKAWTKFGVPRFLAEMANENGDLYWFDAGISCLLSARDEEWGEELLSIDYYGVIWMEDFGNTDDGYPIPDIRVTVPFKQKDQTYFRLRHLRSYARTEGDVNVLVGALLDGSTVEQWGTDDVNGLTAFEPNDDDQTDRYSLLDARATGAKQLFADHGTTPAATVHVGTGTGTLTLTRSSSAGHTVVVTIVGVGHGDVQWSATIDGVLYEGGDDFTGDTIDVGDEMGCDVGGLLMVFSMSGRFVTRDTYSFNSSTGLLDGVVLGTDSWIEKRYQERHSDFAHNCRTARVVMHTGTEIVPDGDGAGQARVGQLMLRGFEVEIIPIASKREDD